MDKQNLIRSSERTFLFEKSDNSAQQYEDTDPDFLGLNDIWRLKFENSKFCFLGPSSGRNYEINNTINRNSLNDVTKNGLSEPLSMDLHHMEHFKWYFGKINTQIHIVSEDLFFSSLSADNNTFGPFASNALINAIFAITILKGPFVLDYKVFKDLARVQVFHEISDLRITSVQTLALLSMIEMNDGNESQASVFIAMACSLSNHLGLHINLNHLVENKSMSQEELNLRQLLFWSCFFIDRIRCPI
ncbi:MAG: fungal specific transcription factor domain-containing protein [Alkalibacterium sp.]|nr:fungal specific transcription factor domain-containing protein [Alkalibacterium sp.]